VESCPLKKSTIVIIIEEHKSTMFRSALCKEQQHSPKAGILWLLCQVNLQITNNAFCIVQRATAQPKTIIFRDCGVAEAPPGF
jgi:hypothetical protein